MKTPEDIESYLVQLQMPHEQVQPGVWIVRPSDGVGNIVLTISGPLVVFRVKVMDVPSTGKEDLYRELLELNTSEMVHAAYGLEGKSVVLTDALELENLDFNEFQATIDDITLSVADHHERLRKHRQRAA